MKGMTKMFAMAAMGLALATGVQAKENLLKDVKCPDGKLNDGVRASALPLQGREETFAQFGWSPFIWDFNLGKVADIGSIRLYSDNPKDALDKILVLGSRDGKEWFEITDLASKAHKLADEAGHLTYFDDSVHTAAQYLKFVLIARRIPITFFFDELEITAPDAPWADGSYKEKAVADAQTAINDALVEVGCKQRLRKDRAALAKLAGDDFGKLNYAGTADDYDEDAPMEYPKAQGFSTVFPQNKKQEAIFSAYARYLKLKGTADLSVWSPYRYVFPDTFAEPKNDFKGWKAFMLRNENRSEVLQLLNSTATDMNLDYSIVADDELRSALEISWLPWTDTAEGIPVSTILQPMKQDGTVMLRPGLMMRLWFTVDSSKLKAGVHKGMLKLGAQEYPLEYEVSKVELKEPRLLLGTWDYADNPPALGITKANVKSAMELMDKMRINAPWSGSGYFPEPKDFDENCNFIGELKAEWFDAWIAKRPNKPMYLMFINNEADVHQNIGGYAYGTEKFIACAASWIRAWDKKLQDMGMAPGRVQWLLVDEVWNDKKADIQVAWSKAFRAAETKVLRNWNDPVIDVKEEKYAEMVELIDSLCAPRDRLYIDVDRKFYLDQQAKGKHLWSYACNGPSRLFDPYSYYKMHGLGAWKDNLEGIGIWSFGDCGAAKAFNEYLLTWAIFTPACIDTDKVYSTLALEAFREGAEDNEILQMLDEQREGFEPERRERTKKLLDDLRVYIDKNTNIHIKWFDAKMEREKADWFKDEAIKLLSGK